MSDDLSMAFINEMVKLTGEHHSRYISAIFMAIWLVFSGRHASKDVSHIFAAKG